MRWHSPDVKCTFLQIQSTNVQVKSLREENCLKHLDAAKRKARKKKEFYVDANDVGPVLVVSQIICQMRRFKSDISNHRV